MSATRLPLPADPAEYKALLWEVLTCMDNQHRTAVENCVVRSLSEPKTAFFLVTIINEPTADPIQSAGVRQLAAVLLRKRVLSMWRGLEAEQRAELKQILLNQIGIEPVRLVRFAIAYVLCVLARVELRHGWPELLDSIHEAGRAPSPEHRELACVLIHSLSKSIVDDTGDGGSAAADRQLRLAGNVLLTCLQDSVWAVRKSALKAVGAIAPLLTGGGRTSTRTMLANELVPRALDLIVECGPVSSSPTASPSEITRVAMEAIEVLEHILDARGSKFGHFDAIIAALFDTAGSEQYHVRVREEATEVLTHVVNSRPKLVLRKGLVPTLLELGLRLVSEDETVAFEAPDDDEDEHDTQFDDGDDLPRPPTVFGGRLLTALADVIPSKKVVPLVLERLMQQLETATEDPRLRKGAIIAVASVSGGGASLLRRAVNRLVKACKTYAEDASPIVRAAAAQALLHFTNNLQPEVLALHDIVVPLLVQQLDDTDDAVRGRVAQTIECVCEEMGSDIEPYVGGIVERLVRTIAVSSEVTQRHICGALAAIAESKSPSVHQYAFEMFGLLKTATSPSSPTLLRAKAIEAVGILAVAVGPTVFTPEMFHFFWAQVREAFESNRPELREMCYGFSAHMAKVLREEFAPHANASVITEALALLKDEKGNGPKVQSSNPLAAADVESFDFAGADDVRPTASTSDSDDDDAADVGDELMLLVRQADVEEKTAAIYCLGTFALCLGQPVWSWLPEIVDVLENCVMHAHVPIRINAIHALVDTVEAKHIAGYFPQSTPAVVMGTMPTSDVLSSAAREALDDLIRAELLPIMNTDDSPRVVAAACDAIVDITRRFGAVALHPYLDEVLGITASLLRREAPCQASPEDEDEDAEDHQPDDADDEDHDEVLIDSVSEIVDTLCTAYGPSFAPNFRLLLADLLPYTSPERPGEDHVFSVGVIAASLEALGPEMVAEVFPEAARIAFTLLEATPESLARSNCCYMIRVLAELGDTRNVTSEFVTQSLQSLSQVLVSSEEMPSTIDNAVSATCSLVRCWPNLVPLPYVLPELLRRLPMRLDATENGNAAKCLAFLSERPALLGEVESSAAAESTLFGLLVSPVARMLASDKVTQQDKDLLWTSFRPLQRHPAFATVSDFLEPSLRALVGA